MRRGERVDAHWTYSTIVHGHTVVFHFLHGVTEERAEGNVLAAVSLMRAKYGDYVVPSALQLAAWLAGMTEAVDSVEVLAVIGHGAVARVNKEKRHEAVQPQQPASS